MSDAGVVRDLHPGSRHRDEFLAATSSMSGPPTEQRGEAPAFNVLHHEVGAAPGIAAAVHLHHVRVLDGRDGFRFGQEPRDFARRRVREARIIFTASVRWSVLCRAPVNNAHPAVTDLAFDLVIGDLRESVVRGRCGSGPDGELRFRWRSSDSASAGNVGEVLFACRGVGARRDVLSGRRWSELWGGLDRGRCS